MRAELAREAARHLQHGALGGVVRDVGHVGLSQVRGGRRESATYEARRTLDRRKEPFAQQVVHTYLEGDAPADAPNQDDAPPVPEPQHLLPGGLRGEQDAVRVHAHHLPRHSESTATSGDLAKGGHRTYLLEVLAGEIEPRRRRRREHARRSDAHVHPSFLVPDHLPDLPHRFLYAFTKSFVALVNLLQKKKCTRLVRHVLADILERAHGVADLGPLFAWLFRKIDAVHLPRARFGERQGELEPDPAIGPGDEGDAIGERELLREQSRIGRYEYTSDVNGSGESDRQSGTGTYV